MNIQLRPALIFLLGAIILFVLFACGVDADKVKLEWIGMALFAAAFLIP